MAEWSAIFLGSTSNYDAVLKGLRYLQEKYLYHHSCSDLKRNVKMKSFDHKLGLVKYLLIGSLS